MFSEAKPYKNGFTVHPFSFHPRIFSLSQSGGKSIELQIQHFARSCTNPPAHSASCRGSGVMRLFGDSPGKARPGLCAFFLQRMRFGKCDNLLDRRGVRAVFEISHIDAAMHRILFKRFEKGIRRDCAAHLFCQQLCNRQPRFRS